MAGFIERIRFLFTGRVASPAASPAAGRDANLDYLRHRSKVDAAETSDENKRHWAKADALGPNAAYNLQVRTRVRSRGRYEAINNSYARGLVRTLAYDLVGTTPRLSLSIPGRPELSEPCNVVERNYAKWARAGKLGLKYRVIEKCASRCGAGLGVIRTNPRLKNPVKTELCLVEVDQLQTPWGMQSDPYLVDGIRFDEFWNPIAYYFLKQHPGETSHFTATRGAGVGEYEEVPAHLVVHWFEQDRPGQAHGIPRITSGLPLFGQLRRYTLATLTAAEFAALLAGIMKTNLPPDENTPVAIEEWSPFELIRGALLTLPQGWAAEQFNPTQPTTTYGDFKREILNETGRGLGAPLNVVSGNSSQYNFSSGRLDHVPYQHGLLVDREDFRLIVQDPVFVAWYEEAVFVAGQIPRELPPIDEWEWTWHFDGFGTIDPVKEATADDIRLTNGTASYADVLGKDGKDWQAHMDQLAREKKYAAANGLAWPGDKNAGGDAGRDGSGDGGRGRDGEEKDDEKLNGKPLRSIEELVETAAEDAGLNERCISDLLGALRPTFSRMSS